MNLTGVSTVMGFGHAPTLTTLTKSVIPQNNLYSYNIIAHSLIKIHISENREKITVQRLIYQGVN
jgi:hypothetical protein